MIDLFKKVEIFTRVDNLKSMDLYPYFHTLESQQAPEVRMNGHHIIMLGSNNYLGLTSHPEVMQAGIDAIKKYGSGCSGSRFLNGTLDTHLALEKDLAEFLNKEACISFGTGFQSNLGIIAAICGRGDYILCDKENHASIYDACKLSYAKMLRYEHSDMEDLERQLKAVPAECGALIVTDGVFSMGGSICKLPEIVKLAKKYGARILVDDAHGFGVLGKCGRGTAEHFELEKEVDLIMGTFSKSLASIGGFVVGSEKIVEYIKHNSRPFIFSASVTPASTACAHASLKVIKREPERSHNLLEIADYARKKYKEAGLPLLPSDAPIIPILTKTDERTFTFCKLLFAAGLYVNPVVTPAVPAGEGIIRTSYMATHNKEQIDRATEILKTCYAKLNELLPLE